MSLSLPPPGKPGTRCWYAKLELPEDDRAQLEAWVADLDITGERIAGALKAYGITASQVQNHRRDHLIANKPCL